MHRRIPILGLVTTVMIIGCATFKPPTLLEEIEPEYPREALEQGLAGTVSMYILVSDGGEVKLARINKSSGHKILDDAALEYAESLTFDPARKGGKPTGVMLTWMVTYAPVAAFFIAKQYTDKVLGLVELANQFSGEEKSRILQEILTLHEEYALYLTENPEVNLNEFIQEFVLSEVYERWRVFWEDWPLRFAVFHDFVLRYPDSDEVSYATARFLDLIKDDIGRIKQAARYRSEIQAKEDLFLATIYAFLDEYYPQILIGDLREDARKYLE